jgi:hypothetical protein
VATLGNSVVSAFSGDDQVVAAAGDDGIDLISWRDAHVVTHLPGTTAVRAYQPGGDAFLVSRLVGGLWLVSPRRLEKISGEPALDVFWPGGGR